MERNVVIPVPCFFSLRLFFAGVLPIPIRSMKCVETRWSLKGLWWLILSWVPFYGVTHMQRTRNGAERTMEWLPSFIRRSVGTKTERLIGKSGWCSGYHDRLTRDRSRVQSPHPILFHFLSLFTHSFHSSFITKHTTLSKQTPHYNNKVLDAS